MGKNNPQHVEEYLVDPKFDQDGVQATAGIGVDGKEYGDPVPLEPPVGYNSPPDIMTLIRSMVREERFRQELEKQGFETFEEADDFDVDDDPMPELTDYERLFYPQPEAGVNGGGEDGTPAKQASKPDVLGEKPSPVATQEASASSVDKSGKGSLPVSEK